MKLYTLKVTNKCISTFSRGTCAHGSSYQIFSVLLFFARWQDVIPFFQSHFYFTVFLCTCLRVLHSTVYMYVGKSFQMTTFCTVSYNKLF